MSNLNPVDTEQQVLALILRNGSLFDRIDLSQEDFSADGHKQIFEAMSSVSTKNIAIDIVSVAEHIEQVYQRNDLPYLAELLEKCAASERNIYHNCNRIRSASKLRKARDIAANLQFEVENENDELAIDRTIQSLMSLDGETSRSQITMNKSLERTLETLDRRFNGKEPIGISTGIKALDDKIGGFKNKKYYIFAGRPGKGKSALMTNFLSTMARNNVKSLVFSLEMENEEIMERLICINGRINSQRMSSGKLEEEDWPRVTAAVTALKDSPLIIDDEPGLNLPKLIKETRKAVRNQNVKIIFLDYLQIVQGTNPRDEKTSQITEISYYLKRLARELDIPVVVLAQLNRDADKYDRPAGTHNLADASQIEKDGDFIGTLYANEEMEQTGQLIIHGCKNRGGPRGDIPVMYERSTYIICDKGPREVVA